MQKNSMMSKVSIMSNVDIMEDIDIRPESGIMWTNVHVFHVVIMMHDVTALCLV